MDTNLDKSRRNLMVSAVAIMLIYLADGRIGSAFGVIQFGRDWVVYIFLWLGFVWFYWRFNNQARGERKAFLEAMLGRLRYDDAFLSIVEKYSPKEILEGEYDSIWIPHPIEKKDDGLCCDIEYNMSLGEGRFRKVAGQPSVLVPKAECRWLFVKNLLREAYLGEDFPNIVAPYLFSTIVWGITAHWLFKQLSPMLIWLFS